MAVALDRGAARSPGVDRARLARPPRPRSRPAVAGPGLHARDGRDARADARRRPLPHDPDRGREAQGLPEGDPRHAAAQRGRRLCPDDRRGTAPRLRSGRLRPRIAARRDDEPRDPRLGRPARPDQRARRRRLARPRHGACASVCRSASRPWPRSGVFLAATIYAATLGAADVAAHTLALRTAGVAYAVPTALLQAAMVRAARAEALGDPASAPERRRERPCPRADRRHAAPRRPRGRSAAARRSLL